MHTFVLIKAECYGSVQNETDALRTQTVTTTRYLTLNAIKTVKWPTVTAVEATALLFI